MSYETVVQNENKEISKLININEDACEFYESAVGRAENPTIKKTFRDLEKLHRGVISTLESHVHANGGQADPAQTLTGQVQKFWGELIASISNDVDETLVSHLEEAEDRCLHTMQNVLKNEKISPSGRLLLQNQLQSLQQSHDYMKTLKDALKAA